MTSNRAALLLAALTTTALAQTPATPPKKPATTATTHSTAATHTATAARPSKDSPPGIPKIVGISKPLYALRYIDTVIGKGPLAQPSVIGSSQADSTIMVYTVHYTGWLTNGTKFDSSVDRGTPITFPAGLRRVISGWDTGFEGMHVGGKRRLFIPYQLAYGDAGRPPTIPAKSDLIFDIELVSQAEAPKQPAAAPQPSPQPPADPARPNDPAKPADPSKPTADPTRPTAEPAKTPPSPPTQ